MVAFGRELSDGYGEYVGWHIDGDTMAEIDRILHETVKDPVGPEFMAPPDRVAA